MASEVPEAPANLQQAVVETLDEPTQAEPLEPMRNVSPVAPDNGSSTPTPPKERTTSPTSHPPVEPTYLYSVKKLSWSLPHLSILLAPRHGTGQVKISITDIQQDYSIVERQFPEDLSTHADDTNFRVIISEGLCKDSMNNLGKKFSIDPDFFVEYLYGSWFYSNFERDKIPHKHDSQYEHYSHAPHFWKTSTSRKQYRCLRWSRLVEIPGLYSNDVNELQRFRHGMATVNDRMMNIISSLPNIYRSCHAITKDHAWAQYQRSLVAWDECAAIYWIDASTGM